MVACVAAAGERHSRPSFGQQQRPNSERVQVGGRRAPRVHVPVLRRRADAVASRSLALSKWSSRSVQEVIACNRLHWPSAKTWRAQRRQRGHSVDVAAATELLRCARQVAPRAGGAAVVAAAAFAAAQSRRDDPHRQHGSVASDLQRSRISTGGRGRGLKDAPDSAAAAGTETALVLW